MSRLLLVLAAGLALAVPALAAERPTLADLEDEIVCPTCKTTLAMSDAPIARQMKRYIQARIDAGDSKAEIKRKLVAEFGENVLAAPPRRGFNLLAWVLPLAGLGVAAGALAFAARRWLRARPEDESAASPVSTNGRAPLDPELERRLDEELARLDT